MALTAGKQFYQKKVKQQKLHLLRIQAATPGGCDTQCLSLKMIDYAENEVYEMD